MSEKAEYEIRLKDAFSAPLAALESKMNSFESKLNGINKLAAGFGIAFGISEGISAITNLATKIVSLGANMEQTRISFETMLGSADRADKVLKQLTKFAEITPFRQDEVIQGSKQLLAYGFAAENLTTDLRKLGDVSAGLNIPLGDLVYLYGTIRTQGKAMTKDLMQFANRGIPIYTELAKVTGKSGAALQAMVEDGQIGFNVIEKAFNSMTGKGSMFGGLMEKLSKSLGGRWSTFLDKLEVMGTTLGTKLIPGLGDMLDSLTSIIDVIPRLDFSPIVLTFQQLKNELIGVFDVWNQLLGVMGATTTKFDALTYAIRYFSYIMKVPYTILSLFFELYSQLVILIKNSVGIIGGSIQAIAGAFKLDFKRIEEGIDKISGSWQNLIKESKSSASTFLHDTGQGWAKIFSPINDPGKSTMDDAGFGSGGTGKGSGSSAAAEKLKGAGIEKIHAGTRNITINIGKLIEEVTFQNTNGASQAQLMDMIKRTLITAVNDVNIVAQ